MHRFLLLLMGFAVEHSSCTDWTQTQRYLLRSQRSLQPQFSSALMQCYNLILPTLLFKQYEPHHSAGLQWEVKITNTSFRSVQRLHDSALQEMFLVYQCPSPEICGNPAPGGLAEVVQGSPSVRSGMWTFLTASYSECRKKQSCLFLPGAIIAW